MKVSDFQQNESARSVVNYLSKAIAHIYKHKNLRIPRKPSNLKYWIGKTDLYKVGDLGYFVLKIGGEDYVLRMKGEFSKIFADNAEFVEAKDLNHLKTIRNA